MTSTEDAVANKIKEFQQHVANARWDDLVTSCYAPNATLSHFMAPDSLKGRGNILDFFQKTPSEYQLDLRYTVTLLNDSACLVAGIGSVDNGAWCPFVERWELSDGDWYIVNDKVYAPEDWME